MSEPRYTVTLGQYKGIQVTQIPSPLTQEELDASIRQELEKHATLAPVDAPAALGDTVNIDFAGFLGEQQFEGGTAQGYDLELGSGSFIPGFEEQLVGACAGQDVDVNVTFPANYHAADLAGKAVVFKCKLHTVQRKQLPQFNDEFVQKTYQISTCEEFMKTVTANLQAQKDQAIRSQQENQALDAIMKRSTVELSSEREEEAVQQIITAFAQQLAQQGLSLEDYFQYAGSSMEQLRAQLRPQGVERAKCTSVLNEIARAEGLTPSQEEIDAEIQGLANAYDMDVNQARQAMGDQGYRALVEEMTAARALAFVMAHVEPV